MKCKVYDYNRKRRARPTLSQHRYFLGKSSKVCVTRSNPSGRQPVAGYFRFSMYVNSAIRKLPNARKDMIVWKVSMGIPPFRRVLTTSCFCTFQYYTKL